MDKPPQTRQIDVLLFDDVNLLDVAGPVQAFETALFGDRRVYRHRYVSRDGHAVRASCGLSLQADGPLSAGSTSDDLLIPGGIGIDVIAANRDVQRIIQAWHSRPGDGRLISICSGALALAASGVLDGEVATTHWSRAADTHRHAAVLWDLDRIATGNARLFTSAGVTTGIDLALGIIRADCGSTVALSVARELVVQLRRSGGQSQYAMHLAGQFTDEDALTRLIETVIADPRRDWTLEALSTEAGMNARTLSRRCKTHMQVTPVQFVEQVRVNHARGLLEARLPLKRVAADSGFGDLQRMRRAFQRQLKVGLGSYAKAFGEETER